MGSLLDAFLLDPYPFQIWVAVRSEKGSGTLNDPYGADTAAKFDAIMALFATQSNVTIHLGPGTFYTQGYAVGTGVGWQARPGMKILGSGVDVTTLQLVNAGANQTYYAIGHALGSSTKADYFEVDNLTIDCGLPTGVPSVACGAVRILGDYVKIRRIRAKNWGTTSTARPCYVFALITALPDSGVAQTSGSGIEDCIVKDPSSSASNTGPGTALHVGSDEEASITNEGFAKGPYIRNCFVDCGVTTPSITGKYRALSMGWCQGGTVEGNQIFNTDIGGPYQDKRSTRDIIVRGNYFKNVARGPWWNLGVLGSELGTSGSFVRSGNVATVSGVSVQGLAVGDRVKIVTSSPASYSGAYVVLTVQSSPAQFTVNTPVTDPDTDATVTSLKKVFGVSRAIIEGNEIELAPGVASLAAAYIDDNNSTSYPEAPDYVHGDIFIRDNKSRYIDGVTPTGTSDLAIQINGAKNLAISNNVIDSANTKPMQNQRCGSVEYFNNKTPAGLLIQGWNIDTSKKYDELETDAEDALILAMLRVA
jgi:hypothetical protein